MFRISEAIKRLTKRKPTIQCDSYSASINKDHLIMTSEFLQGHGFEHTYSQGCHNVATLYTTAIYLCNPVGVPL
jgi:hypothetical protein